MQNFFRKHNYRIVFLVILLLAALLRFYGLNWDQNQHLHPDERFLTMVTQAIQWPKSTSEYFSTTTSPLNPYNKNFSFFVYGTFPIFLTKFLTEHFGFTDYNSITLFGRFISGLFDLSIIILIFLIGKKVFTKSIGLLASFFYTISVLPIQLSHFYAVDTFLNSFIVMTFYSVVQFIYSQKKIWCFVGGLSFGLALASKISALAFIPAIGMLFLFLLVKLKGRVLMPFGIFLCMALLSFRTGQPYAFMANSIFDLHINPHFIQNLQELKNLSQPDGYFPPAVQWNNTISIVYPLQHMVLWGLGIPLGIVFLAGFIFCLIQLILIRNKHQSSKSRIVVFSLLVGVFTVFIYQGIQFAKPMRYFLPLYPPLALLAGIFSMNVSQWLSKKIPRNVLFIVYCLLFIVLSIWPLSFMAIYSRLHSRVAASEWIYKNIPTGSTLTNEHWDDGLPLSIDAKKTSQLYKIEQLPLFDPDTEEKWNKINQIIKMADYIVITSNRVYGSVPRLPKRYSKTIKYYEDLFSGKLDFVKAAEFTSRPTIFGFEINDDNADEVFTVYDHPKVTILKNNHFRSAYKNFK